jgi:hypothetical protein
MTQGKHENKHSNFGQSMTDHFLHYAEFLNNLFSRHPRPIPAPEKYTC